MVIVGEGQRIPADALLRRSGHLEVDESLLTGESVPVAKRASDSASVLDPPGGDGLPSLFSGTLVTAGGGVAEVVATGPRTRLGAIGGAVSALVPEPSFIQTETRRMVRILAIVGLGLCAVVVVPMHGRKGCSPGSPWRWPSCPRSSR
jgi:Ca2+-transporting ATPase